MGGVSMKLYMYSYSVAVTRRSRSRAGVLVQLPHLLPPLNIDMHVKDVFVAIRLPFENLLA
jgi:hypothetical protein